MKRTVILLLATSLLNSCSTLRKTIVYSSLSGALAGASTGYLLSPDEESRGANAAVFGIVGAGISALVGYSLYEDDPRNKKLNHLLEKKEPLDPNSLGIDLGQLKIDAKLSQGDVYKSPSKKLPKKLRGKIKEQYIIKYQSKERYVNKGDKTYYIPSFEIYEHAYETLGDEK
ncbi:MAG: hypothetical protein HON90_00070 [Halobacteriovoraceae bacterium]|jgi:hypothetical protein|nr:hypothetical protein [Halobacteriovoraceae bacterium]